MVEASSVSLLFTKGSGAIPELDEQEGRTRSRASLLFAKLSSRFLVSIAAQARLAGFSLLAARGNFTAGGTS